VLPSWGPGQYWLGLAGVFVAAVVIMLLAMIIFGRVEGNFAEEL
jgi:hypothetical protein